MNTKKLLRRHVRRLSRPLREIAFEASAAVRTGRAPRRFHAYCVGAEKTGTHSIAGIFARDYRATHEPEPLWTIDTILSAAQHGLSSRRLERYLRRRDRRLWLELESSNLCYHFIRPLVHLFPDAKFILTIRDCYSWLNSLINHRLAVSAAEEWHRLHNLRFNGAGLTRPPEERVLEDPHLYTIDGYLAYWSQHNRTVIETVPAKRLLIVRTDQIRTQLQAIADFIGVPFETLDKSEVHSYRAKKQFGLLAQIPSDYLETKVNAYCGELMEKYFPDCLQTRTVPETEY